jgi:hypothetical protein
VNASDKFDRIDLSEELAGLDRYASPEDFVVFRLAQLAILLSEVAPDGARAIDIERLGYYDFFAANPFAIFDVHDRLQHAQLHRASFDERQLSYASTGSRFANRRRRLQHDVALLVAYGLAGPRAGGYGITSRGTAFVDSLAALYVDQYRESVQVVHGRLRQLSDTQLALAARRWLTTPSLLLDLYGSAEADPSWARTAGGGP